MKRSLPPRWLARAPSNIALVKYMGKSDPARNLPENPSLSMTLEGLCSWAELAPCEGVAPGESRWVAELPRAEGSLRLPKASAKAEAKVLAHVARVFRAGTEILPRFDLRARGGNELGGFEIRTANTFPEASGIASSASSFAALTAAAAYAQAEDGEAFLRAWERDPAFRRVWASVSREGSGSSCRSFEGPWVRWDGEEARAAECRLPAFAHFVLLISQSEKEVSSSEAHSLVKTSPLWQGRAARARARCDELSAALSQGDLSAASRIAWAEMWEMHSLFHTARDPFTYWQPGTLAAIHALRPFLLDPAPPILTLDAGPNVHVLVPSSEAAVWRERLTALADARMAGIPILEDRGGTGVAFGA